MMLGPMGRKTATSRPSGRIMRARVPVVLATVHNPASRRAPATRRVTLDLPRVPATWIRVGIRLRRRAWGAALDHAEGEHGRETGQQYEQLQSVTPRVRRGEESSCVPSTFNRIERPEAPKPAAGGVVRRITREA